MEKVSSFGVTLMLSRQEVEAARHIRSDDHAPQQHRSARGFRTSIDCRLKRLIKYPNTAEFHSYAEYLYAGLCEGDPQVSVYIPQPFRWHYRGKRYQPDAFVVRSGKRYIVELKPDPDEFDAAKKATLEAHCILHNMTFIVISNQAQVDYETRALNWHRVIKELVVARDFDTSKEERQLMQDWPLDTPLTLGDWVDPGDRESSWLIEIALFRLAHRGWLTPQFDEFDLDWSTEFTPCRLGEKR